MIRRSTQRDRTSSSIRAGRAASHGYVAYIKGSSFQATSRSPLSREPRDTSGSGTGAEKLNLPSSATSRTVGQPDTRISGRNRGK